MITSSLFPYYLFPLFSQDDQFQHRNDLAKTIRQHPVTELIYLETEQIYLEGRT